MRKLVALLPTFALSIEPVDKVQPFIGSGGFGFGAAGLAPAAQLPFGSMRIGPDTAGQTQSSFSTPEFPFDIVVPFEHYSGYSYEDEYIRAFSHTRLVGAGVGDYGNFGIMPISFSSQTPGVIERRLIMLDEAFRAATHDKSQEFAKPGQYAVLMDLQHGQASVIANVTATGTHTGKHQYTFETSAASASCGIVLDVCHTAMKDGNSTCKDATVSVVPVNSTHFQIQASLLMSGSLTGRSPLRGVKLYFSGNFFISGSTIHDIGLWANSTVLTPGVLSSTGQGSLGALVQLGACPGTIVNADVAISFISAAQARENLAAAPFFPSFDAAVASARSVWAKQLGAVTITQDGDWESSTKFYSMLYQAFRAPSRLSETGGVYMGMDGNVHTIGEDAGDVRQFHYSDMSLWDIHRTQLPLLSLVAPDIFNDIIRSLQDMARTGGDIPRWPLANVYTGCMIASHGFAAIAEAVLKGHTGFNASALYAAMYRQATEPTAHASRAHVQDYLNYGFVPQDDDHIATSLTLSYAFDDWSVAQVANYLGKTDDASTFRARALAAYPKIWNSKHELMCPLYLNGNSNCSSVPFTPYPFEDNYVEGSALQWLWFVPHDPAGLVGLFPTNSSFVHKLTNFFVDSLSPEQGGKWPYANVLANGWYWAGNEPDLLTPWLFAYAGAQYRTANWTRWLNNNLYTVAPDGVPGNDDFGTMSSWYVWAALGIYPQAGSTRFIIGSPRWNAYIAQRNLTVNVINGGQQNLYVQQASVNGRVLTDPFLEFSDLVDSVVTFTMGALPSPKAWANEEIY